MNRPIALVFVLLAWLSGSACSSYHVAENSIQLRYVPKEDVLLVLEVQLGIVARSSEGGGLEHAAKDLIRVLAGRRAYPPQGGLPAFDLDDEPSEKDKTEPWYPELMEIKNLVHVEQSRVFLDNKGRLGFVRLTRVDSFRRFLEVVNTYANRALLEEDKDVPTGSEFPAFDAETAAAMRAAMERNHAWLSVKDGALVLEMPMTQANAARCLAWLTRESSRANDQSWQVILDAASSLEITGKHAQLRFGDAPKRTIEFAWKDDVDGLDPALRQELADRDTSIGDERSLQEVREAFDTPPAPAVPRRPK